MSPARANATVRDPLEERLRLARAAPSLRPGPRGATQMPTMSAFVHAGKYVEQERARRVRKFVATLAEVPIFQEFDAHQLRGVAQYFNEVHFEPGECVMRQGGAADALYVILRGEARVTQRADDDPHSEERETCRLHAPMHFGDLALLNDRGRAESVFAAAEAPPTAAADAAGGVAAAGLSLLKLPRGMFSQVLAVTSLDNFAKHRDGVKTIMRLPLFESLEPTQRKTLARSMKLLRFAPGDHLCTQGAPGDTFFVIIEGSCKVTTIEETGVDRERARLTVDDYFGEVAFFEKVVRTMNVVAEEDVACMAITRARFNKYFYGVGQQLIAASAMRRVREADYFQDLIMRKMGSRKETAQLEEFEESGDGADWHDSPWRVRFVLLCRAITLSLRHSMYTCLFREIRHDPSAAMRRLGSSAARLVDGVPGLSLEPVQQPVAAPVPAPKHASSPGAARSPKRRRATGFKMDKRDQAQRDRDAAAAKAAEDEVKRLAQKAARHFSSLLEAACAKPPWRRSPADMAIILGLVTQRSAFHDRYMRDWPAAQVAELCRRLTMEKFEGAGESGGAIITAGSKSSTVYVILRGLARVLAPRRAPAPPGLEFVADLRPGDVFGEDALDGVGVRQQTVIAVSDVECFAIDASEFALVIEQGRTCSTADDKFAFLRTVPLFAGWEAYKLYQLAFALDYREVLKGQRVCEPDVQSQNLFFVLKGTLELTVSPDQPALVRAARRMSLDEAAREQSTAGGGGEDGGERDGERDGESAAEAEDGIEADGVFPLGTLGTQLVRGGARLERKVVAITMLGDGEYFGESGLLNLHFEEMRAKDTKFVESCLVTVFTASAKLLMLRPADFKLLSRSVRTIRRNFELRTEWRNARLRNACTMPKKRTARAYALAPDVQASALKTFGDELAKATSEAEFGGSDALWGSTELMRPSTAPSALFSSIDMTLAGSLPQLGAMGSIGPASPRVASPRAASARAMSPSPSIARAAREAAREAARATAKQSAKETAQLFAAPMMMSKTGRRDDANSTSNSQHTDISAGVAVTDAGALIGGEAVLSERMRQLWAPEKSASAIATFAGMSAAVHESMVSQLCDGEDAPFVPPPPIVPKAGRRGGQGAGSAAPTLLSQTRASPKKVLITPGRGARPHLSNGELSRIASDVWLRAGTGGVAKPPHWTKSTMPGTVHAGGVNGQPYGQLR